MTYDDGAAAPPPRRPYDREVEGIDGQHRSTDGFVTDATPVTSAGDPATPLTSPPVDQSSERPITHLEFAGSGDSPRSVLAEPSPDDLEALSAPPVQSMGADRVPALDSREATGGVVAGERDSGDPFSTAQYDTESVSSELLPNSDCEATPAPERSVNGPFVVGDRSSPNNRTWFSPNWFKLSPAGATRDIDLDHGLVGDIPVLAVSIRGTTKQFDGVANQDAFSIRYNDEWIVGAVADGVGSAKYSSYGARFLSDLVVRDVTRRLVGSQSVPAVVELVQSVINTASELCQEWMPYGIAMPPESPWAEAPDSPHALLATTLTLCVVRRASRADGTYGALVFSVGDSPAYALRGGVWDLLTDPTKEGEIVDNYTAALPARLGAQPSVLHVGTTLESGDALFLMSDGVSSSLRRGNNDVGKWLAERLGAPCLVHDAIDAIRFDRKTEDDDRTLLAVWLPPAPSAGDQT